jgi:5-methylthioadenosine/S-adenosylhomocysteine deaminase
MKPKKRQKAKKLIIPKQVVTADSSGSILRNTAVEINKDKIVSVKSFREEEIKNFEGEVLICEHLTLIPGFIQTHVHICQTLFRGLADELDLLDWLQKRIFPYENVHNDDSMRISAQLGLNELMRGGTTTILDMGSLRNQEIIFDELIESGIRAFAGKCLIDTNDLFEPFCSSTKEELRYSEELAKNYHNKEGGRIKYAFAPRFVLTCTEELLKETRGMMNDFDGSLFHSHASENSRELTEVRKKFKQENVEYFHSLGIIDNHSVLAHCIHINENELDILKKQDVRVAHCPSSNLKLGSGIADIPRFIKKGISVSLGADGAACNNSLSAFIEMRLAALIQKPLYGPSAMDPETVFRMATIEGAKALHIDNETGSIEEGKKADLVLVDLDNPYKIYSNEEVNLYSDIIYSSSKEDVIHVMIDGKWVVKDGVSLKYDEFELFNTGKKELTKLLERV